MENMLRIVCYKMYLKYTVVAIPKRNISNLNIINNYN